MRLGLPGAEQSLLRSVRGPGPGLTGSKMYSQMPEGKHRTIAADDVDEIARRNQTLAAAAALISQENS